jgi:hypothetical protein
MQQLSCHCANPISSASQTLQLEPNKCEWSAEAVAQKSLKLSAVTRRSASGFLAACKWNCGWASLLFIKSPSHTYMWRGRRPKIYLELWGERECVCARMWRRRRVFFHFSHCSHSLMNNEWSSAALLLPNPK